MFISYFVNLNCIHQLKKKKFRKSYKYYNSTFDHLYVPGYSLVHKCKNQIPIMFLYHRCLF